ncbi:MAG TPA: alpha-ketoglutarate-dependent dioxygenase AlkB [Mycobacteriales bacterium]|nr:alpha-ketoglutarate-dependent dioxygenase AlkB [Mycobacteriales bacterium]
MTDSAGGELMWQDSLFGTAAPGGRLSFAGLRHEPLDDRSWIDVVPGWVPEHERLFEELRRTAPWAQRTREMWDEQVLEPRLVAAYASVADLPASLEELRAVLSERYAVRIDSCLVNLYRDGSDAVAWHGDTVRKVLREPLVFTVSLGARRRFLVQPAAGGATVRAYVPGEGDLIVMGGRTQHEWLHAVPRDRRVSGARMSVTFRHSRPRA